MSGFGRDALPPYTSRVDTPLTDAIVGRLVDGRYRVVGLVARGGMATVYEAVDERLDRHIALKVMHPVFAEDPEFVERFISEARSAARLSHPGIVAVFDQGTDGDVVYLAMEFVQGHTLRQLLRQNGKLGADDALAILDPALDALAAAHRAGIVHRDIKPENILLSADGRVRVADFGLARAVDASSTLTRGVLLGTVAYVSPEQTLGQVATPRSDVYAAGVVLFELLTGHAPHTGATDFVVARKHSEEDVPAPSAEIHDLPPLVDELVRRATARDPHQRYADAAELLAAVRRARRVLDGVPYDVEPWETAGVSSAQALGGPRVASPDLHAEPHTSTTVVRNAAAAEALNRSAADPDTGTADDHQHTSVISPVGRGDAGDGARHGTGRRAAGRTPARWNQPAGGRVVHHRARPRCRGGRRCMVVRRGPLHAGAVTARADRGCGTGQGRTSRGLTRDRPKRPSPRSSRSARWCAPSPGRASASSRTARSA